MTACSPSYWTATADKLKTKAFKAKSSAAHLKANEGTEIPKVLGALDLTFLGIGGIIGAGVFVLTGVAARQEAGPSVVLSYLVASFAAVVSALCYTEFAVDTPLAGGAYIYTSIIFGEFSSWVVATNLLLEYTLGAAAVARSFTSYLGALISSDADLLRVPMGSEFFKLDVPAMLLVSGICYLLGRGTQGGARFNTVVTIMNLVVIAFVLATGLPHFNSSNFKPFFPKGLRGTFSGASKVFFSFIGFDAVSTAAEETRNPGFDLPMGIVASLLICAALYAAMCVTICGMVYWDQIDVNAPFAAAYDSVGWQWAGKVVALGAIAGIITSLLVNLFGQIRLWLTLGRENLVPRSIANIHTSTQTPVNATILTAITAGAFALFVDLEALADLVSIGALFTFFIVALACIWRRYVPEGSIGGLSLTLKTLVMVCASIGMSVAYIAKAPAVVTLVFAGLWVISVGLLYREETIWVAQKFRVPLNPVLPSLAVLSNLFLIASLGMAAYIRFAIWLVLSLVVYVLYGVHHSQGGDAGPGAHDVQMTAVYTEFPGLGSRGYDSSSFSPSNATPRRAESTESMHSVREKVELEEA